MAIVRYYLDEHVSRAIEHGLQQRLIDAVRAFSAGNQGADDAAHLAYATELGRVVYTNDTDFLRLHALGNSHAGIVYAPVGISVREAVEGLAVIHQVLSAEEMQNHVGFL